MPVTLKTNSFKYKDDSSEEWSTALVQATTNLQPAMDEINELASNVGIVINGARPTQAVTTGQYVIVQNSSINGVSDGLYTAKNALATGTDVTAADLNTKITNGAANEIKNTLNQLDSNKANKSDVVSNITRSETTFTATRADGTTFTFDQQDTNTWRGIQNNLTSISTTDSLSAAQGKALNDKINGKIGSFTVNIAGQAITASDIGGFYGTKSISSSVPSGATLIGVKWESSGFDGGVSVMLLQNATLVFSSAKSCTLPSGRTVRVFYYK